MSTTFDDIVDGGLASFTSGALNNTTSPVTTTVSTGQGALLPAVVNGWYGDVWDKGSYANASLDPGREVVRVTSRSGDSITFTRNQLGTTASNHSSATNLVIQKNLKAVEVTAIETAINNLENGTSGTGTQVDTGNDASLSDMNGFRLSTVTQTPVSPDSSVAASTLYFTPYINKQIATYGGSTWQLHTAEEISASAPSPDGMYDVFVNWYSGSLNMQFIQWDTNILQNDGASTGSFLTASSDRMLTDGNDNTQRYVGSVYVSGGNFQDNPSGRYVWNFMNKVPRGMSGSVTSASNSTNTWTSELAVPFCVGSPYDSGYSNPPPQDTIMVTAQIYGQGNSGSGNLCEAALTLNTPTPDPAGGHAVISATVAGSASLSLAAQPPNPGLNSINLLLRSSGSNTVTLSSPDGSFNSNAIKAIIYA